MILVCFLFLFTNHSLSFACFPLQQFWFWRQLLDGAHLSSCLPNATLPSPSTTFLVCCALYCLPLSFSNPFPFFSFSLHVCHRFGFLLDHENVCGAHQRTTHCKNGVWFRVASGGAPSNSPSLSIDDHSVSDVYSLWTLSNHCFLSLSFISSAFNNFTLDMDDDRTSRIGFHWLRELRAWKRFPWTSNYHIAHCLSLYPFPCMFLCTFLSLPLYRSHSLPIFLVIFPFQQLLL